MRTIRTKTRSPRSPQRSPSDGLYVCDRPGGEAGRDRRAVTAAAVAVFCGLRVFCGDRREPPGCATISVTSRMSG